MNPETLLTPGERDFRRLVDHAPDNIARYGPDGRYLYVNRQLEASLGIPATTLVGKRPSEVYPDGRYDASPRGGPPGFVKAPDGKTLFIPDAPGNNRLDTLTNITQSPAVGLLFFLPGFDEMLRVNGIATTTTAPDLMARFVVDGKPPRSVMAIEVKEVYLHCTKALKRSELWNAGKHVPRDAMPSFGQMLRDPMKLAVPAEAIDGALRKDERDNLY